MHRWISILVLTLGLMSVKEAPAGDDRNSPVPLGSMKVDGYPTSIFVQLPKDHQQLYRVDVAISKPWDAPHIKSERIQVWLLARNGIGAKLQESPRPGALIEAGSRGATADAIFLFERIVNREELVAVVVAIDRDFTTFKIPPPSELKNK